MNATEVLAEAAERGIAVWPAGEKIRFRPRSAMTAELVDLFRKHKSELLAALRSTTAPGLDQGRLTAIEDDFSTKDESAAGWPDAEAIPIESVEPCPTCRRIDHWQDGLGTWRCRTCSPPKWRGAELAQLAQSLRSSSTCEQKNLSANSC